MATSMADLGFNIDSKPMKQATTDLNKMSGAAGKAEKSAGGLTTAAKLLGSAIAAIGVAQLTRSVFETVRSTEKMQASLKTVTGSLESASAAWGNLVEFAKTTPFTLDQSVNAFIRMKSMGLDPSNEALKSFANTASAMGKDLTQMIEAVADASVGGFVRLEEFGIKGSTEGDKIKFTFQGITTEVGRNASEITKYLRSIGEVQFAGATDDQMNTLNGQISNLEDSISGLYRTIGDAGATNAFKGAVSTASDAVIWLSKNIDTLTAATAGLLAAGIAGYMISAAGAMSMYQVVLKGALATQIAFNAVAAINPYVLITAALVGTIAALAVFNSQQESVIDVWNRARESEAAYEAALNSSVASKRVKELTDDIERFRLASEDAITLQFFRDDAFDKMQKAENELAAIFINRRVAENAQSARQAARDKSEAEAKQRQIDLEKTLADAKLATAAAEQKKVDAAKASEMADFMAIIDEELSGLIALKDAYGDTTKAVRDFESNKALLTQMFNLTGSDEYIRMLERLVADFSAAGEEAGEVLAEETTKEFVNEWQSVADSVANSLQDAIASGDWKTLGDGIGNALAASISGIVSRSITDELSKGITADSGALSQIGAAFGGAIGGAIAGAAVQIIISEIMDYLSDDFDPTEARQASQGTGTVLGSINAKSESIAEATEASATASEMLIGINRDMLRALLSLQAGISRATARVARGAGDVSMQGPGIKGGMEQLAGASILGQIPAIGNVLTGVFEFASDVIKTINFGLIDWDKLLGGRVKKRDEGIQIIGGYMTDLIDETIVNAFQTFRVRKHRLDDYDTKEVSTRIGGDVERQFALVFESIFESVGTAADALGVDAMAAMQGFQVSTQRISLEGLNAEQQQAELEAYFGTVFDNLAEAAVPFLEEFQKAGEGLGETLARVANEVQVTREVVAMLGGQFSELAGAELVAASERLVELSGGIETFITNTQGFVKNFASDARQFEITAYSLSRAMGDLPLPETRQGFFDLMSAQDAATEEGAENIATLLRLQSTADNYYSTIEKAQERYFESEISGQRDRLNEAVRAQSAVESALGNMILDSRDAQAASRSNAIMSLEQMARSGRVRPSDSLDRNLSAATAIQASDFSTFGEYVRDYTRTTSTLIRLKEITDEQVTVEERMLNRLEKQLEAVQGLRKDLEISQLAIIKQTNKTAGILERMELDGIEIRS